MTTTHPTPLVAVLLAVVGSGWVLCVATQSRAGALAFLGLYAAAFLLVSIRKLSATCSSSERWSGMTVA